MEFVKENYDLKSAKIQSPNKLETNENPINQNFDIISQLVGDIQTQKLTNVTDKTEEINKSNNETVSISRDSKVKKRTNEQIQSPSIVNSSESNIEPKKAKLSSQTIRNLKRFEFKEKEEPIIQKNEIILKENFEPLSTQSCQSIDNSQISKTQKTQSKIQYSQKTLSSINDDDLNFDF